MATCPVQWWTEPKGATLEPTMRQRGRLGPRAGIPKRQLPNCHSCQRGTLKTSWVAHKREGAERPQCAKGKGTEDPGVVAPLHLAQSLGHARVKARGHWLLQVVAATACAIRVDGRMRRPVRVLRRAPGQARRGHFRRFSFTPRQLRQRVGLHHLDLLRNCSSWDSATPMTECHCRMLAFQRNSAVWKRSITLRAVRAESCHCHTSPYVCSHFRVMQIGGSILSPTARSRG